MKRPYVLMYSVIFCLSVGVVYGFLSPRLYQITEKRIHHIRTQCEKASKAESASCLRGAFAHIVNAKNLTDVMVILENSGVYEQAQSSFQVGTTRCHEIAHIVGESAGLSPNASSSQLISACGVRCGYGCTHGVIMGVLKKDYSRLTFLDSLCSDPRGSSASMTASNRIACYHGLGHGLAEYARYSVPEAIRYCETLHTRDGKDTCFTGVFMEVYTPADSNHEPIPIPKDIFSDCAEMIEPSFSFCKRMMIAASYRSTRQILPALALCHEFVRDTEGDCVLALGADAYFAEQENIENIIQTCGLANAHAASCIQGAVLSSISIHANGTQALEICEKSGPSKSACFRYRTDRLQAIGIDSQ